MQKATIAELRSLCERIIAAQSREIEELQRWLADWYGSRYEPQMQQRDRRMLENLALLSGDEFNIEISKMFIRHHHQIIVRSETALKRVYHDQLRDLAQNIITTQSREIEEFRGILCTNYGICNYGPKGDGTRAAA